MFTKQFTRVFAASALVAGAAAIGCKDETATIRSAGDALELAKCTKVTGNVVIDTPGKENTDIDLSGQLSEIAGDFTAKDNKGIQSIRADNLRTIGGTFSLENIINLNELSMTQLSEVGDLKFTTLTSLNAFDFGTTGITKADTVIIGDTRLKSIDGINVETGLQSLDLNNNPLLSNFTSNMKSLSTMMTINVNALQLDVSLPKLEWIANMTISDVNSFSIPSLKTVNGSMRFYDNKFRNFEAPKLEKMDEGDLSFVSHGDLTNLSFPALESVAGGFTIANNTKLTQINGFPELSKIGGAGAMRGAFKEIEFPKLQDVQGVFEIESTEKIQETCSEFEDMHPTVIQGKVNCDSAKADALGNTDEANSKGGKNGGNGGDDEGAASLMGLSMTTLTAIAGMGMVFTMF